MQHFAMHPRISISTTFSICLFMISCITESLAASLHQKEARMYPAISIPRALLVPRQREINITQVFINNCGLDFTKCSDTTCCPGGEECLFGSQTGKDFCRSINGGSPSQTPSPSSSSSKTPIGAIVGGVLGAVAIIAIICVFYLIRRRRRGQATPAIPQPPIPNLPNVIEAKYPPPHETSYSGENWPPGSFLYHNRNRSVSTATSCLSPDAQTPLCEPNTKKDNSDTDQDAIIELPGNQPTMELQGDDSYFVTKPYVPPPPAIDSSAPLSRSLSEVSPMSPRRISLHWKSRGS